LALAVIVGIMWWTLSTRTDHTLTDANKNADTQAKELNNPTQVEKSSSKDT
jgi:hypothetical protein